MELLQTRLHWKNHSRFYLKHEEDIYVREETKMKDDFHTISWYTKEEYEGDMNLLYYYSRGSGWNTDDSRHLNNDNPMPLLERLYSEGHSEKIPEKNL